MTSNFLTVRIPVVYVLTCVNMTVINHKPPQDIAGRPTICVEVGSSVKNKTASLHITFVGKEIGVVLLSILCGAAICGVLIVGIGLIPYIALILSAAAAVWICICVLLLIVSTL